MKFRIAIATCFFLILPIIGLITLELNELMILSRWDYFDFVLSVLFATMVLIKKYLLTKILGTCLITSVVLRQIIDFYTSSRFEILSFLSTSVGHFYFITGVSNLSMVSETDIRKQ